MHWFLKGYYGYKNFGDELLLLGLLSYIFALYPLEKLYIEAEDTIRLSTRLQRHSSVLPYYDRLFPIAKHSANQYTREVLFLWWGEVLTDGRPFPYNGRNYLLWYRRHCIFGVYHLFGGIGTPSRRWSTWLWRFLLSRATTITVREKRSFAVVTSSIDREKALLYHDFAYDVLRIIPHTLSAEKKYLVINVNPYIRSEETKRKILLYVAQHPTLQPVFFSAEAWVDDVFFDELRIALPSLQRYDWTDKSMQEICDFFACCARGIAARLHVLLLLRWAKVPFEALVYQEKISTFLEACSDE